MCCHVVIYMLLWCTYLSLVGNINCDHTVKVQTYFNCFVG